ncbi:NifX-associated nitrogen fixation protein [Agaribacterium haliotis]|uniref:NifX-associated nitrogen fixation protein n=1 Tax=Agaribacterium haliotis TaxID=2013869 RepID=UPI000BB53626|nr:NifX-associated nitrogen fixation protein [Agaribacterium haliotis]
MVNNVLTSSSINDDFQRYLLIQLRALGGFRVRDSWSDERVMQSLILSKEQRRALGIVADPDEASINRLKAYYNAVAQCLEQELGLFASPFVHVSSEGFGRALVVVGRLLVINKTLRDVHRFSFISKEQLLNRASSSIEDALLLARSLPEAARC